MNPRLDHRGESAKALSGTMSFLGAALLGPWFGAMCRLTKERKLLYQNESATKSLCACGKEKKPAFRTCWKCKADADLRVKYSEGFRAGIEHGKCMVKAPSIPKERIRQLLQLCHPDKHNNSLGSNDATRWLLKQRDLV